MKVYVLISMLVVAIKATDFTCATTELAVCCRLQTDDFSKCKIMSLRDSPSALILVGIKRRKT